MPHRRQLGGPARPAVARSIARRAGGDASPAHLRQGPLLHAARAKRPSRGSSIPCRRRAASACTSRSTWRAGALRPRRRRGSTASTTRFDDAPRRRLLRGDPRATGPALATARSRPATRASARSSRPDGAPAQDFVIQGPAEHGVPGLVNLYGIESPGLTASLAIADHVTALVA